MRLPIDHKRAQNPLDYLRPARHRASLRHIGARPAVQTIRHIDPLKKMVNALRDTGRRVALVPTMGALHAGHMALVTLAQTIADEVIVSIFINPIQFGPNEDLGRYPRQEAEDSALLADAGVAALWLPDVATMYPHGFATTVSVAQLGDGLCGAARPGHFDGVATVVAKLLTQVKPDIAIFGEKDWQQLAIIRRMARDLNLDVEIVGAPIVRDGDGLALSSRNAYLSAEERSAALALPHALQAAAVELEAGVSVAGTLEQAKTTLLQAGFVSVDYIALVDAASLEPLEHLIEEARIVAAARIGTTRLIDNFPVRRKK
jgi:pantoate--beta-alanine ligase